MKKLFLIGLLSLSLLQVCWGDENPASAFCEDQTQWDHFSNVVKQNPNDVPLQILHALKIGLCVKIKQNSITTNEAIHLFNDMLESVANKRGEEAEQKKDESS